MSQNQANNYFDLRLAKCKYLDLSGSIIRDIIDNNEFMIGDQSNAKANADKAAALEVPLDILGVNRTEIPDIGAYQHIIFDD